MPEGKGYKKTNINQISEAIEMLQEAVMGLEDGEMKDKIMELVMPVQEAVESLEPAEEMSPEDQMLGLEEGEEDGLDLGEPQPFQPEKAGRKEKSPFGALTEEE